MKKRLFNTLNLVLVFLLIMEVIRRVLGIFFFFYLDFWFFFDIFLLGINAGSVYLVHTRDKWGYLIASVLLVKEILHSLLSPLTLLLLVTSLALNILLLREILVKEKLEKKIGSSQETHSPS